MARPAARAAAPRKRPAFRTPPLDYNMRAIIVAALIVVLLFSPFTFPIFGKYWDIATHFNPNTFNQRTFPKTAEFNITRTFTMTDPSATAVSYHLNVAVPYNIDGIQDLINVSEDPRHTDQSTKRWWNGTVAAGSTETVSIRYHVKMTTFQWEISADDVGTTADVPSDLQAKYLDQEWRIDPTSAKVVSLAEQVTSPTKNYLQQIDDMYTYLNTPPYHYALTQDFRPQLPDTTIDSKQGDCDDFSVLFISMARHLGIPAWLELGLLYDETPGHDAWGAHGWVDVYIPFKAGSPSAAKYGPGAVVTIDIVNKLFLIRDPYHFSDWSSDGDAQHLEDYYTLLTYNPQVNPPFTLQQSITHDVFVTSGVVNYLHP